MSKKHAGTGWPANNGPVVFAHCEQVRLVPLFLLDLSSLNKIRLMNLKKFEINKNKS